METKIPKLDLNVTNRCNFQCVHCAFDSGLMEMPELKLAKLEEILEDTKKLGGRRIDITGGEPLIREDIDDIVFLCKSLDYKTELVTSASLLTEEKLEKYRDFKLDAIAISLDGSNSQAYNRIRRRDRETFDRVLFNIQQVKKQGFYTKINTTVFDSNLHDLENIIKLCLKFSIDEVGFYYFSPVGRGSRSLEKPVEALKWLNFTRTRLRQYSDSGLIISMELPLIENECWLPDMACVASAGRNHLQILPDGNVYPCAILASYGKPIANLYQCSLKDICNNQERWQDYWKSFSGNCLNLDCEGYSFVCPIKKFSVGNGKADYIRRY